MLFFSKRKDTRTQIRSSGAKTYRKNDLKDRERLNKQVVGLVAVFLAFPVLLLKANPTLYSTQRNLQALEKPMF